MAPEMKEFVTGQDSHFLFDPNVSVKESVLGAIDAYDPHAIIFATNSFWNLPGHPDVEFGKFLLRPDDVSVPVLSFDPFEIGFHHKMPVSGQAIDFPSVPSWVWALRYMSLTPATPNARHFRSRRAFRAPTTDRAEVISRWAGAPDKRSIFFPISTDRFRFIQEHYPDYYHHVARLIGGLPEKDVQCFVVAPEKTHALASLPNVIQLPHLKFNDFLSLINASDVYLTDSFISCIVDAFQLETPSLLLANSEASRSLRDGTFLNSHFFPYRVFPYGMVEVCEQLESLFGVGKCYWKAEVLDIKECLAKLNALLFEPSARASLVDACQEWKAERDALSSPRSIMDEILGQPSPRPPVDA